MKILPAVVGAAFAFGTVSTAEAQEPVVYDEKKVSKEEVLEAPPVGDFKKVSELTALPEFIPNLGTLYVKPADMPIGPYLAYDRNDKLVSTVYMVPLEDLNKKKAFQNLSAYETSADHIDFVYNPGHSGLNEPHYHVIVWHVPVENETRVALERMSESESY